MFSDIYTLDDVEAFFLYILGPIAFYEEYANLEENDLRNYNIYLRTLRMLQPRTKETECERTASFLGTFKCYHPEYTEETKESKK